MPTNSRYFLHDDRRVNEEEKEEKEIFGRGGDGEDFWWKIKMKTGVG